MSRKLSQFEKLREKAIALGFKLYRVSLGGGKYHYIIERDEQKIHWCNNLKEVKAFLKSKEENKND